MTTETENVKTHISPEMEAAVGSELGRRVSYPVTDSDIRRWAIAIYYPDEPPRIFWDAEYAATAPLGGIVAPEEFNPFAWMAADPKGIKRSTGEYDPDSMEKSLGVQGPGLKFMLNGGMEVDYGVRMRPGDVITAVSRLYSYKERPGRLGLMLMSTTEDTWTNQKGEMVKKARNVLIRY